MTKLQLSSILKDWYNKKTSHIILLPGKPGLGKTEFLKDWINEKPGIYLRCELQHDRIQIPRFLKTLQLHREEEIPLINSWEGFFQTLFQPLIKNKKTVIVLDEFPKLIKSNRTILSTIEKAWFKKSDHQSMMLILCGSSMPDMNYSYLRLTGLTKEHPSIVRIPVYPLNFNEFKNRFKEMELEDLIALYGNTGGIELFVSHLRPEKSLKENLMFFLDHRNYHLLNPIYLFNYDFHDPTTYFSILQILAFNEKKIGNIAKNLALKTHNLTSFLDRLRELEIIDRTLPPTDLVPEASRKGRYHILDPFYRFWFRYVYPYQDILSIDRFEVVLEEWRSRYPQFMKEALTDILSERLTNHGFFPVLTVGPWWDKNKNIDLIAVGERDILFAGIYFLDKTVGLEEWETLVQQADMVDKPRRATKVHFLLLSRQGFSDELKKEVLRKRRIHLWTLHDLLR